MKLFAKIVYSLKLSTFLTRTSILRSNTGCSTRLRYFSDLHFTCSFLLIYFINRLIVQFLFVYVVCTHAYICLNPPFLSQVSAHASNLKSVALIITVSNRYLPAQNQ